MDFEEITHNGGEIFVELEGTSYRFGYKNTNLHECQTFIIKYSALEFVSMILSRKDNTIGIPPEAVLDVFVISDSEGYFGRKCPKCERYFRMTNVKNNVFCPYCGLHDSSIRFNTMNQSKYIDSYLSVFVEAVNRGKSIEVDLNSIIDGLDNNYIGFKYKEERQQKTIYCNYCDTNFNILGEYGYCPNCKKRNSLDVLFDRIKSLETRVLSPIYDKENREKREKEWEEVLKSAVSDFEGFCNDINSLLAEIPMTPKRRSGVRGISFQNIKKAYECYKHYFEIDIFNGVTETDRNFLNKCFNKRHLFTHKSGVVDQEYLVNTKDTSVRLGQKIRIRSNELLRLLELIKKIGQKIFDGYESIH